jgi:hypothetical protein
LYEYAASNDQINELATYLNTKLVSDWFESLENQWQIILACFFIAFGVAAIYMIIVRYFAGVMVWTAILIYLVLTFLLAYFLVTKGTEYEDAGETDKGRNLKYTGYVIYGMLGISIIIILCSWKKI